MRRLYRYVLPAMFTAGNLFCGFMAVLQVVYSQGCPGAEKASLLVKAAWFILFAMIFDIMDGRVARLTKGTSSFGAELDSLADVVSFGLAPAVLAFFAFFDNDANSSLGLFAAFVFALCGALRLARFNVAHSSANFTGLPIPGGAALIATLVLFNSVDETNLFAKNAPFLLLFVSLVGGMMVSTVPYPCLKGGGKRNARAFLLKATFAGVIITGNILSPERFLFAMALAYATSGPVYALFLAVRRSGEPEELPEPDDAGKR